MEMFSFDESFIAGYVSLGKDHVTTIDENGRITTDWRKRNDNWRK